MKIVIGIILFLAALAVGIYVDIVIFFVGGIHEIIRGFQHHPAITNDIIWGFVKTLLFTGLGTAAVFVAVVIVALMWSND